MTRFRKLIAVLAVLCLTGAQQAAFAHWAAHLGAPAVVGLESQNGEHAAAAVLGQSCTSCTAFASLDAALPGSTLSAADASAHVESAFPAPPEKSVRAIRRYDSRAPPAVL
ncbi:MAG: hypothetical protein HZC23_07775 [Rhodocyclales bacterium]|nr:hypothetical protein [Rhodocyclales bacterium]